MREDLNGPIFDNEIPNTVNKGKYVETIIGFIQSKPTSVLDIDYGFTGDLSLRERSNIIFRLALDISDIIECEAHNYWSPEDTMENTDLLNYECHITNKDGDEEYIKNGVSIKILGNVYENKENPEDTYAYFYRYGVAIEKQYKTRTS